METTRQRRRVIVDDRPLALAIGERLRNARKRAGLTQQALAGSRYTKAYISALETGVAKPSMAALNYLSERLGFPASTFVSDSDATWTRLQADLLLAAGDFSPALEAYGDLIAGNPPRIERAAALTGMAEALCRLDRSADAIKPASEAVAIFAELDRPRDRVYAEYWLAYGHHGTDNADEARSLLRATLDRVRGDSGADPDFHVRVLIALGVVETAAGRYEAALAYLQEADGLAGDLDARRRATYLQALAVGYRRSGDHEAAIRAGIQALALFRQADASIESAMIANQLALTYLDSGSLGHARDMARTGRDAMTRSGNDHLLAHIADTEARIALASGEMADAERLADEAIALSDRTSNRRAMLDGLLTKARILEDAGRPGDASDLFAHAAGLVRSIGPASRRRTVLGAWADALARSGHHDQAYELMREALQAN